MTREMYANMVDYLPEMPTAEPPANDADWGSDIELVETNRIQDFSTENFEERQAPINASERINNKMMEVLED